MRYILAENIPMHSGRLVLYFLDVIFVGMPEQQSLGADPLHTEGDEHGEDEENDGEDAEEGPAQEGVHEHEDQGGRVRQLPTHGVRVRVHRRLRLGFHRHNHCDWLDARRDS